MNFRIEKKKVLTLLKPNYLEELTKNNDYNLIAGGCPRGGTSMLGILMKYWGFNMGDNLHPEVYEDLDFVNSSEKDWKDILTTKCNEYKNYSVKLPNVSSHLSLFDQICPNPVFLLIIRNPLSVTHSVLKNDPEYGFNPKDFFKAMTIPNHMFNAIVKNLPELDAPIILVEHEKIMASPIDFIMELKEALNVTLTEAEFSKSIELISTPGYKTLD